MRTAILCGLAILAGCGKERKPQNDYRHDDSGSVPIALPQSDIPRSRWLGADGLAAHYAKETTHRLERNTVLVHCDYAAYHSRDGEDNPVVEFFSDHGFKQPKIIFRLASNTGWKKGATDPSYIEGILMGCHQITSLPWAEPWHNMTPQLDDRLAGRAVVVDNCRIVAKP